MTKSILISIAAASLVLANQPAQPNKSLQNANMAQKAPSIQMLKKKLGSPFLIKQGLPHFTMLIKEHWDNPKLALTEVQKSVLLKIRKKTLDAVMSEKPKVMALQKEIIAAINSGTEPEALKEKVDELAKKQAALSMVHLECIYNTKKILTKEQIGLLTSGSL